MPQLPLIALTEGSNQDIDYLLWHASIQQFADEVSCSQFFIIPNSGHYIQIDQPQYVIAAIKTVVLATQHHVSLCQFKAESPANS